MNRRQLMLGLPALLTAACATQPPAPAPAPPKLGLALGGGAARGFAHVGVIKMLESQGLQADIVVGTSAGSIVGALYAAGHNGFELQELSFDVDRKAFTDWQGLGHGFGRGLLKGEALQAWVNQHVGNRPIEQLTRSFACVAVKLRSGEPVLFRRGEVGLAVRASSAVPGVFVPPQIEGEDYVDGGTVAPVPVSYTRACGADVVVAVDISAPVTDASASGSVSTVLKTFDIMGRALSDGELKRADVVIAPALSGFSATDFESKNRAILEGEKAALAALPAIRAALAAKRA